MERSAGGFYCRANKSAATVTSILMTTRNAIDVYGLYWLLLSGGVITCVHVCGYQPFITVGVRSLIDACKLAVCSFCSHSFQMDRSDKRVISRVVASQLTTALTSRALVIGSAE